MIEINTEIALIIGLLFVSVVYIYGEACVRFSEGKRRKRLAEIEAKIAYWESLEGISITATWHDMLNRQDADVTAAASSRLTDQVIRSITEVIRKDQRAGQSSFFNVKKHQELDGADNPHTVYKAKVRVLIVPNDETEGEENNG